MNGYFSFVPDGHSQIFLERLKFIICDWFSPLQDLWMNCEQLGQGMALSILEIVFEHTLHFFAIFDLGENLTFLDFWWMCLNLKQCLPGQIELKDSASILSGVMELNGNN